MLEFLNSGFNAGKLKSRLKMTAGRLDIDSAKKSALMKQNMREVAELLAESPPREDKARLRTEALIADDRALVAYDILKLECILLMERVSLMGHCKECPPDLVSSVSDLIFAAPRVGIPELIFVRKQFRAKYGKEFKTRAMNNEGGILNAKIVNNLSLQSPTKETVNLYMEKICKQYEVDWQPTIVLSDREVEPASIPVVTGMDAKDESIIAKRVQYLDTMEVLPPPPCAPGHNHSKNDEASTTTSSSSKDNDSDGDEPPADAPTAIAMPCITRQ